MAKSSLSLEKLSVPYPRTRTTGCCRSLKNCGKRIPPYPVTLQTISKVLPTMILHSSCSRTVRWKMQSVWITSSTSYRLQIWFCRIRILPFEEYTTIELLSVSILIVISTFALDFIHSDRSIFLKSWIWTKHGRS